MRPRIWTRPGSTAVGGTASHACTLYQPAVADGRLDFQRATERPCSVIGLRTVVIREDMVVTAIAENRAAACSNIKRCLHPTRCLRIELAQRLQLSIPRFREDLNPHGGRHVRRAVLRLVLLSCLQRFPVVTQTAASFGTFR